MAPDHIYHYLGLQQNISAAAQFQPQACTLIIGRTVIDPSVVTIFPVSDEPILSQQSTET